ncbi:hypothetical protein ACFQVB_34730 [Paraburkholderia humisilvae]|uniref:hypothetical protein n=1 Tax=Paraburkholderia humisilvae TaxID=627669 RepID=UPI00361C29BF
MHKQSRIFNDLRRISSSPRIALKQSFGSGKFHIPRGVDSLRKLALVPKPVHSMSKKKSTVQGSSRSLTLLALLPGVVLFSPSSHADGQGGAVSSFFGGEGSQGGAGGGGGTGGLAGPGGGAQNGSNGNGGAGGNGLLADSGTGGAGALAVRQIILSAVRAEMVLLTFP